MKKKLLKRIVTIAAAATLTFGMLTGCGGSSGGASGAGSQEETGEAGTAEEAAVEEAAQEPGTEEAAGIFRTLDEIKESGKIVIGVFSDKAPFGYVDENGAYQ